MNIGIVGTRMIPMPKQQKEISRVLRKSLRTKNVYFVGNTFGIPSFIAELLAYKKKEINLIKHWNGRNDITNHYLEVLAETSISLHAPEDVTLCGSDALAYRAIKEMNEQIIKLSEQVYIFAGSRVDVITMDAMQKCNYHSKQYFLIDVEKNNDIKI